MENIVQIGKVVNDISTPIAPDKFRDIESQIIIKPRYQDGLFRIEECEYITIVFYLHKNTRAVELRHVTRYGEFKGVFSSRSPTRPSRIAISTVRLLKVEGNKLTVKGLDAINETPILDIKPYADIFDSKPNEKKVKQMSDTINPAQPRKAIIEKVLQNNKEALLLEAGTIHGHYCPGLALGIHLGVRGMQEIHKFSDGIMENLLAVTEMNNCAVDGIQYVSGCTIGNNSLIFEDIGKNAVTFAIRDGKALRISVRENWREDAHVSPEYTKLFEKVVRDRDASPEEVIQFRKLSQQTSFQMMQVSSDSIVKVEEVEYIPPSRAPIHPSFHCAKCGELTMGSRKEIVEDQEICLKCAGKGYNLLSGHGIHLNKTS